MCYSAEVAADFHTYQRMGGALSIKEFAALFYHQGKAGTFTKLVPRAVRDSFAHPHDAAEREIHDSVIEAYRAVILHYEGIVAEQTERLSKANAVLASPKPTKKAETDKRVAQNKIRDAELRIAEAQQSAKEHDGFARIWPGHFCPVLIRDPETGERLIDTWATLERPHRPQALVRQGLDVDQAEIFDK